MATQSFTVSQLDPLPEGYPLDGSEYWLTSVLSGSNLRSFKASTEQLSSYFVSQSEWVDDKQKAGQVIAYGTYYVNGDTRERIFSLHEQDADVIRGSLQTDSKGVSYNKYLHSGNIHVDQKYRHIYFCRGTWPRRQGQNSDDKDGWTWRELGGIGEAICRTNLDGTNFKVIADLETLGGEYYEPSAVVFDDVHDYIFFACRNGGDEETASHGKSKIYRMDMDGSNLVTWLEMATPDVNIDCLDIAHIPEDFFGPGNPSCTSTYLYFGISPDYVSFANTAKQANAAVLRVPVIGSAPGQLTDDYTGKYCIHRFWHSSYKHTTESNKAVPDMETTGVKGIKVFISNLHASGTTDLKFSDGNWVPWTKAESLVGGNPSPIYSHSLGYGAFGLPQGFNMSKLWTPQMSKEAVARDRSRIYVVHSGARNIKRGQEEIVDRVEGPGTPIPPMPDVPSQHTVDPALHGFGYGGNSVFELLVGEPPGNPGSFSVSDDAARPFKTWRRGTIQASGNSGKSLTMIDDPAANLGLPGGSGIGSGRGPGNSWQIGDHVYILTSPEQTSYANGNGLLDDKSGRGVRRLISANGTATYGIANCSGDTNGPGETGAVMVIPVIASNLIGIIRGDGSKDNDDAWTDSDAPIHHLAKFGLQDITINPCTLELFFTDFFGSAYYISNFTFQAEGATTVPHVPGVDQVPYQAANPPNPVIPGNPPNPDIPGNALIPGNAPTPATPYNPYVPGTDPIAANDPIAGQPGNPDTGGNPGNPEVPFEAEIPEIPLIPAGIGVSQRNSQPDDSYYGTIYRADSFTYGRLMNGSTLFHRFEHVGYNRPCGISGYPTGPWNEFRLIYTNGETQVLTRGIDQYGQEQPHTLLDDTYTHLMAARGREINGLSQVWTRDHILAAGKNIFAIYDFGFGTFNGLLVTLENPATTGDYSVFAQASNGDKLTIPTLHIQGLVAQYGFGTSPNYSQNHPNNKSVPDTLQYLLDDPSLYQAKNSRQFRICYPDKISGLEYSDVGYDIDPKTVNTIFFEVVH